MRIDAEAIERLSELLKEFGAEKVFECFNCGNCTAVCPVSSSEHMFPRKLIRYAQLGAEDILLESEEPWLCLVCRHCTVTCPRDAFPSELMVAARKEIVEAGGAPKHIADFLTNISKQKNPWGVGKFKRAEWVKKSDVSVPTVKENPEFEWLWFVGCAHSFDNRNMGVTVKLARIFNDIGLNFAILGREEGCCGNDVRRAGEEGLFQVLRDENIETFEKYGVEKIVTASPHCYNTLKNEYEGYEVKFALEIIYDAIKTGKLQLKHPVNRKVTYHDPCYLGRYNGMYELPREILKLIPGIELIEMPRNRSMSFCCGGGNGNIVGEYPGEIRPNNVRAMEAAETGADVLAVACPFCMIMLEDGVKTQKLDSSISVYDIIELVYLSVYGEHQL